MFEQIKETTDFLKKQIDFTPEAAIVLGSGLGNLGEKINIKKSFNFDEIPNFKKSTVEGHKGKLIFGELGGKNIVALQGRLHYYEGHSMKDVTFPIRVMIKLGIKLLMLSNAAGGMNPNYKIGDIMIINDHINMMGDNPLMGPNDDRLGPRFPDMSEIYSQEYINLAKNIGKKENIDLKEGVYVAVSGPTFETPAEYKTFRIIGGDNVGMSTVPEAIVARHMGIAVFALSVVTDLGIANQVEKVSHKEVLEAAKKAEPKMTKIFVEILRSL
jgi:purine-nucleoside phosphorylase